MRIGVAATPGVAIPTLEWLSTSKHDLSLVITRPDKPAGRGRAQKESLVGQWAAVHQIECVKPISSQDLFESLAFIDLVVTIGYGVILPVEILSLPRYGFINLHFSLLPAWRGAAPVQRAIQSGEKRLGITVFALDAGMDTGPIYVQRELPADPYANAGEVLDAMATLGPDAIAETLTLIESGFVPIPQSASGVSYAPKISKEDAHIRWESSALEVDRQIRAFTPDPGAWTTFRNSTLRIDRARLFISGKDHDPGVIDVHNGDLVVSCADAGKLFIEELTPAGKKTMSGRSWINGARIVGGERFV